MPSHSYVSFSPTSDFKYVFPLIIFRASLSVCTALYTILIKTNKKERQLGSFSKARYKLFTDLDVKQSLYENIN
jgi:hypothetical protein